MENEVSDCNLGRVFLGSSPFMKKGLVSDWYLFQDEIRDSIMFWDKRY